MSTYHDDDSAETWVSKCDCGRRTIRYGASAKCASCGKVCHRDRVPLDDAASEQRDRHSDDHELGTTYLSFKGKELGKAAFILDWAREELESFFGDERFDELRREYCALAHRFQLASCGAKKHAIEVVESPRPETLEEEDRPQLEAFRAALEDCANILELPGFSKLTSVPAKLEERLERDAETIASGHERFDYWSREHRRAATNYTEALHALRKCAGLLESSDPRPLMVCVPEVLEERLDSDAQAMHVTLEAFRTFRAALEDCANILELPGSPSLTSVPAKLEERLECDAQAMQDLKDQLAELETTAAAARERSEYWEREYRAARSSYTERERLISDLGTELGVGIDEENRWEKIVAAAKTWKERAEGLREFRTKGGGRCWRSAIDARVEALGADVSVLKGSLNGQYVALGARLRRVEESIFGEPDAPEEPEEEGDAA